MAGQRGGHDEGDHCGANVAGRVGQERDQIEHLVDGTRVVVAEEQRQGDGDAAALVDEVGAQVVHHRPAVGDDVLIVAVTLAD